MQCSPAQADKNSRNTDKKGEICWTACTKWLEQFAFCMPKRETEMLYNWASNPIPGTQMNFEQTKINQRELWASGHDSRHKHYYDISVDGIEELKP